MTEFPVGTRVIFKSHVLSTAMKAGIVEEEIAQSKFGPLRKIKGDDGEERYVPLDGMMAEPVD